MTVPSSAGGAPPAPPPPPAPSRAPLPARGAPLRTKLLWVATLYFASGFPFSFLNEILPVYFREGGVSLADIGLLSLATLPYTFKFLWAPLVDRLGTRRHWVLGCQLAIAAAMLALAASSGAVVTPVIWVTLLTIAALSATQDVAVDAYTIEQLEPHERGPANGLRVTAYRLALIAGGGLLLAASARLGWPNLFRVAGATMLLLAGITLLMPSTARAPAAGRDPIWEPLRQLLTLPAAWAVALFVLTFKLGDLALQPMIRPFWVDAGYTAAQIGTVVSTVGTGATIAGALAGGLLTLRLGTFRALWMLGLVQALSNLGYYAAAAAGAPAPLLYAAAVVEQFATGLGTAAFLTFLMSLCDRRYAATQYALLSALYRVGGVAAGSISGFAAERMGYGAYFLFTFALAFPAFLLLPQIRRIQLAEGVRVTD